MTEKGTILVVDDTPATLRLLKDLLAAEGYQVLTANSGTLALRSLAGNRPDLILLDIRMPDMDGYNVCRRLKAEPVNRDIPVIFISASSEISEKVEGFELGAVDFISKPFQREELLARVQTHLELKRLRQGLEQQVRERTEALEKSNRAYRALSLINRLVAHARQEDQLLQGACEIVRRACGYRMVWLGLTDDDAEKKVRAAAQAGFEDDYLASVRITWADEPLGRGPTGAAIRTRKPSINRNALSNPAFAPWREQAVKRGYKSSAAFPLLSGEQCLGALMVYSEQVDAFTDEEVKLLNELSANLSYGIRLLRTQAQRHRSEELLRASEEKYRSLTESTSDVIWEVDGNGRFTYCSPRITDVLGYLPDEIMGKSWLDLMPDDEAERLRPQVEAAIAARAPFRNMENRNLHRNGSQVILEANALPIFDHNGGFAGYRGIDRDITERRCLEAELQDLNRDLQRRVEEEVNNNREKDHMLIQQSRLAAMGEMVHNIAHQWRQPLNALGIILGNIKDDYDYNELTPQSLAKNLSHAHQLLQRLSSTIDDFRDFFRPDREPGAFDVADSIEDALSVMDAALRDHHIGLVKSLPPGLRAYGFSNQLSQVVLNIVANAKEAIQQRRIALGQIEVGLERSADTGILTITDNAGGIPEAVLPRIFDPYFTTKEQGSGIGLYMSKMILERNLHGTISAANGSSGAVITVSLPLFPA